MNRTEALTEVLHDPSRSRREKEIAAAALGATKVSTGSPRQELSPDSKTMLLALGKDHLREISEDEFARYALNLGNAHKQELCKQLREWVCPDDSFLDLIGLTRTDYWRTIHDHATSEDVRTHARAKMAELKRALP